ncbi:uncharacterized protein LOC119551027 [Drosophila subpulchrella]|uniref:uncharacterized protein LOC119551027 n=1 Tax=Drosophila subpulchrella TaxID=1486046 RepID=UPI0018A15C89|nr:uncharacterized protein LOC119551027 [Drosophila subpulchrella]
MCNCDNYTPSCSATFYPIWCMVWGGLSCLSGIIMLIQGRVGNFWYYVDYTPYGAIALIFGLFYLFGGLMMMLGVRMNKKNLFKTGKILSYFYAIPSFGSIFILIVHIFAVIKLCRYIEGRWG